MSTLPLTVEKRFAISSDRMDRLNQFAIGHGISEDRVVEKALDILFSLTELLDENAERRGFALLSENALRQVWDNDADAAYDNWRELYAVPAR
ncbi:MAG: hypothetical protein FJ009_03330 [Chloroflexi bacterium]|nr:hypothetical protein [Chloroflexota bacterium]